jgi:hypothetical protein
MPKPTILNPKERYSFSQYFDMNYAAEDILADLGCHLIRTRIHSPKAPPSQIASSYQFLQQYLERNLKFVNPVTEISRREVLISPTLMEVCSVGNATLNIEYNLTVSDWLRGNLDYYISTPTNFLVIEAKQADLSKGFTQLAVELIALDQWISVPPDVQPILYGAVTTGDIWKIGCFDRATHTITEDRSLYRVTEDLEELLQILVGILTITNQTLPQLP